MFGPRSLGEAAGKDKENPEEEVELKDKEGPERRRDPRKAGGNPERARRGVRPEEGRSRGRQVNRYAEGRQPRRPAARTDGTLTSTG